MTDLKRTLGLPSLLFYGVGVIVGAGIYSIVGAAAGEAGRLLWLAFIFAAIPAALAALNYAELIAMFPRVGGEYVFLRRAAPGRRWVSFAAGFVVAVTNAATAATVSLAFAGYLTLFVEAPAWLSAAGLLVACTAVNVVGIRESAWVTAGCTLIEVLGLALIVGAGVRSGRMGERAFEQPDTGVFAGAALIFFVYTGFEGIANLAEETQRPRVNLPRALLISGAFTTALYVLVGLAAVALVEPQALAESDSPLSTAGAAAADWLAPTLAGIALFSTANTALITLVVASRLLLGMAREGDMPAPLARVLPGRQTPWVAALVMLAAAGCLLPLGEVAIVGSVSSLATLTSFAAVAVAVIVLRKREPQQERPFRIPLAIGWVPVTPVLTIVAVAALMTQFTPAAYFSAAGALATGLALYATRRWWASASNPSRPGDEPGVATTEPAAAAATAPAPTPASARRMPP